LEWENREPLALRIIDPEYPAMFSPAIPRIRFPARIEKRINRDVGYLLRLLSECHFHNGKVIFKVILVSDTFSMTVQAIQP
jgi:hypothetical protein